MIRFFIFIMLVNLLAGLWWYFLKGIAGRTRNQDRRAPLKEKITLEDVRDLLRQGKKELAILAYREIYTLNYKQAEMEVEQLERYMKK